MDDDKTIMIYQEDVPDASTQIIASSEPQFSHKSASLPKVTLAYNFPFLDKGSNQPFLMALRTLYREVLLLMNGEGETNIDLLQRKLIDKMDYHTRFFSEQGIENTHIMIVRYIISTFIDEFLGTMSWRGGEAWANYSLLGHYYQETYGGEKFFELLEQFAKEPVKYMQHMKLIYVCLSLGYKGKYSLVNNADMQVESIRQELYARISSYDEQSEKFYNDHPASTRKHKLTLHVPYKMFIISGFLIMGIIYGVFTSMVSNNEKSLIEVLKRGIKPEIKKQNNHAEKDNNIS